MQVTKKEDMRLWVLSSAKDLVVKSAGATNCLSLGMYTSGKIISKGDVGMSLHEKGRNKKMPTPRHKVTHNPIPTSLFCFNMLFVCLFVCLL